MAKTVLLASRPGGVELIVLVEAAENLTVGFVVSLNVIYLILSGESARIVASFGRLVPDTILAAVSPKSIGKVSFEVLFKVLVVKS